MTTLDIDAYGTLYKATVTGAGETLDGPQHFVNGFLERIATYQASADGDLWTQVTRNVASGARTVRAMGSADRRRNRPPDIKE